MTQKTYSTSEIAKKLSTTKRTLRFYDQIGLLTPSFVSAGGHRVYTDEDVEKLYKIRLLKSLGLSLKQVKLIFEESALGWEDLLQQQLTEIEKQLKKYKLMQEIVLVVQRSIKLEGKIFNIRSIPKSSRLYNRQSCITDRQGFPILRDEPIMIRANIL